MRAPFTVSIVSLGLAAFASDWAYAAEVNKPAPKAEASPAAAPAAPEVTDGDLQNLVACARMKLPDLTPEQIAAVAIAIKHAEDDIAAMRKAKAVPVEIKDEKK